jgi:phosphatidate cytidylyltransferase
MRKRILVGTIMAVLAAFMLTADLHLDPAYPFLLLVLLVLALAACRELHRLMSALPNRPSFWLCAGGVLAVLLANWPVHILDYLLKNFWGGGDARQQYALDPWQFVTFTFATVAMAAFVAEMPRYHEGKGALPRIALTLCFVAYLGLLPSFLVQLRWPAPPPFTGPPHGALTMAIFVPKLGDVAAYFTGRFFGRHRMTPSISPKKTWEGFAGGLAGAVMSAVVLNRILNPLLQAVHYDPTMNPAAQSSVLRGGDWAAIGFGLTVGLAGVLGDLAESLIKRDCRRKDAADTVPGFGGVLDVIDSILFAAPVAYLWLRW